MYSLYHIGIDPDLGTGYIGITKNANQRFSQHGWQRQRSNRHLRFAIKKYGNQVFKRVVLSNLDKELAELCEEMLRPEPEIGWNITKGGGVPPNPKGKVRSSNYCQNISKAKMGSKNPMFGKKIVFSEEHRTRLSKAAKEMKLITCPHCGYTGKCNGMKRWHFDRCRDASI